MESEFLKKGGTFWCLFFGANQIECAEHQSQGDFFQNKNFLYFSNIMIISFIREPYIILSLNLLIQKKFLVN